MLPSWFFSSLAPHSLIVVALLSCAAAKAAQSEEFVGPFASWKNIQSDYGAVGDGKADDTAAVQRALDDLVKHEKACVAYLPAGTYRITRTLKTMRKAHTDCMGVTFVGESPTNTFILWDGPDNRTMLEWDAWYSKISRLTFDGTRRAGTALLYGPSFSTYNETSDLVFRDCKAGLVFGGPDTQGQAENEVLRCQFLRCDAGIQTVNWNSMDIWVWYCRFEDCGRGVHNVMGNWHAWENLFLRSTISDLSTKNLMAFSAVNNTSIASKRFFDFATGHTWGSPVSVTGNRVIDSTGDWAMLLGNAGPFLVIDNSFRLKPGSRAIKMTWGDQTLVGNRYTETNAVEERGRFRRIAEAIIRPSDIADIMPELPITPSLIKRKIFEVPAGAGAFAIQEAIDNAAKLVAKRPVVHLPMGNYRIDKTLTIPAGCDLQFVGDGGAETGTRLNWTGQGPGPVLRIKGPSGATFRDFYVNAGLAQALVVENVDQPGARIFADQLNSNGSSDKTATNTAALRIVGLNRTDVLLRALQGSGNAGKWVDVLGSGAAATNRVSIFTGATGSAAGQYDVRNNARLVVRGVYHERSSDALNGMHLTGSGVLSIDATRFSYATSATAPTVASDSFRGLFTLATCILMPVETKESCRFELRGNGSETSVLALNNQFWINVPTAADDVWKNQATPAAHGGLIGCNINTSSKTAAATGFAFLNDIGEDRDPAKSKYGSGPLQNRGTVDDSTILKHLDPLRSAAVWYPQTSPGNTTDLRLHRVMATSRSYATVEIRSAARID